MSGQHDAIAAQLLDGRLVVTMRARTALRRHCRSDGPQELLLSWPSGVNYLPATMYLPGEHDVIVGHVATCAVHADLRQLALFRMRRMILDAPEPVGARRRPMLRISHV
jgi:hypothetical protein